jgi:hypothetical protein
MDIGSVFDTVSLRFSLLFASSCSVRKAGGETYRRIKIELKSFPGFLLARSWNSLRAS